MRPHPAAITRDDPCADRHREFSGTTGRNRCFFHSSHAIHANRGEAGPTPHNAWNRKGGARRIARTSAAMEAAMTRRLDAFATPGVYLTVGAEDLTPPHNPDAPLKSL
jgi:hypothetical protein